MTVKEFAQQKGITRQAVYQAIRKSGKQIGQFTDESGNLTETGLSELGEMFKEKQSKPEKVNYAVRLQEMKQTIDDLRQQVEDLTKQNRILTDSVDSLSRTLEKQTDNLNNAQQLHGREILRLEAAAEAAREPGKKDPDPDLSSFSKRFKFLFSGKK